MRRSDIGRKQRFAPLRRSASLGKALPTARVVVFVRIAPSRGSPGANIHSKWPPFVIDPRPSEPSDLALSDAKFFKSIPGQSPRVPHDSVRREADERDAVQTEDPTVGILNLKGCIDLLEHTLGRAL